MAKNPLLKSVFRAQLQAEAPDATVGISGSAHKCPIANALAKLGLPYPAAGPQRLVWKGCKAAPTTTKWQRAFMHAIDHAPGFHTPITAARALEILEGL